MDRSPVSSASPAGRPSTSSIITASSATSSSACLRDDEDLNIDKVHRRTDDRGDQRVPVVNADYEVRKSARGDESADPPWRIDLRPAQSVIHS